MPGVGVTIEIVFADAADAIASRASLYSGAFWSLIWEGMGATLDAETQAARVNDRPIDNRVRRVLDDGAAHCETCPPKAGIYTDWDTMLAICGGLPGDGSDQCHSNCRCELQHWNDQTGEWSSFFE